MARMIGKSEWHTQCPYGCCRGIICKDTVRKREERDWRKDLDDELEDVAREVEFDERHARGICKNNDGTYGCDRCYDSTGPAYAEDLDEINGVTTNMRRLN